MLSNRLYQQKCLTQVVVKTTEQIKTECEMGKG